MEKINLSILILSIPERLNSLGNLLAKLDQQIKSNGLSGRVEVASLLDNCTSTIASKRNSILDHALGRYVAFLDDDDDVSQDYVLSLVENSQFSPDVITFKQRCKINGRRLDVSFGLNNPHEGLILGPDGNYMPIMRPPYHICAWKAEIAKSEKFREVYGSDGQSCEDIDWCMRLYPKIKNECHVNKTIHLYTYDDAKTKSKIKLNEDF